MKSSQQFAVVTAVASLLNSAAAFAAHVDMNDPRRALGREGDIRIDAQLLQESVSPGATIGIRYQIENLGTAPVAIADRVCDLSYDPDTSTVTISVGSEVPKDGIMPKMVVIAAGETRAFTSGAVLRVASPAVRSPFAVVPRLVQIKVTLLHDLAAFRSLLRQQAGSAAPIQLDDSQFETWMEANDTIFLNSIPVRFEPRGRGSVTDVENQTAAGH
jgi:hypothetical protein